MKKKINEVWKDVVGYKGLYQVSNYGRVKSLPRTKICQGITMPVKGKEISLCNRNGYKMLCLYKDGGKKIVSVHRLVAEAFIPNPENKPCVDHIDGNRSNNFHENLRWCTFKENMNNPITYPRNRESLQNSWNRRSKTVYQYSLSGQFLKEWVNAEQAAAYFKGEHGNISGACKGKYRYAYGYRWSYEKKEHLGDLPPQRRMVKVAKMDEKGNILAVFNSIKEAAESLPNGRLQDISSCANGRRKKAHGYVWKKINN